ncbi:MAG: 4Fe-4S binding protein [Proteobacteria bacterium]|nr:4Fe-4S binding protein [Pseudomonadota bacterium]
MTDKETYQRFIDWFRRTWWDLPESVHLHPMIETYLTPEEVDLLTNIPHSSQGIEEIARTKGMAPETLEPRLRALANRGMIYESSREGSVRYRLNDSFFAMLRAALWPGRTDEATKNSAPHINRYFLDGWMDQYAEVHLKGLRALPIDRTIEDKREIMPHEDVVHVVDDKKYFCVTTCPCRHRHNLDPDMPDCPHPTEVCLHFDELAHYIVNNGLGREITREETRDILKKAADSGLVHGVSNWKDGVDTICNCCSCCCMWFESFHKLGHSASMDASNYRIQVRPETCKACALCVKRCPVDALQLRVSPQARNKFGKAAVLDPDRCIGCGVCSHKCPSQSLRLVPKDQAELTEPPRDPREYMKHYLADRKAAAAKNQNTAD